MDRTNGRAYKYRPTGENWVSHIDWDKAQSEHRAPFFEQFENVVRLLVAFLFGTVSLDQSTKSTKRTSVC